MNVYCDVCKLNLHSEIVMLEHCKGKKHKRNQSLFEKRKDLASRSVFTRGFPPQTDEATLRQYFSKFGDIQRILKDKERGVYAIIEFAEEDALTRMFSIRHHSISGHRVVIKPREFKPPTPRLPESTFHERIKQPAQSAACKALETELILQKFNYRVDCLPSLESLQHSLLSCQTVEEQMAVLYEEVKLQEEDLEARRAIVLSLTELFQQFFAGCQLHVFGSCANGFATKGCDMDLFLDLRCSDRLLKEKTSGKVEETSHCINQTCMSCPNCEERRIPKYKRLKLNGIKSLQGKDFPLSAEALSEVTLFDKVKLLTRILNQFDRSCSDAMTIPSVRCPVARFTHSPTSIRCDLSINNRLALQNTRLLKFFFDLDPRVKLLMFTIRYWGKFKEVSGNAVSGPRLTNYALSLLVIFFLQNCQPPILPTVERLAQLSEECLPVNGWNCAFSTSDTTEKTANTHSEVELLKQFFSFYCAVDFSNVVLMPRTGSSIPISDFGRAMGEKTKQFKMGALSVQDPFVLDHNVTFNVNDKVRLRLVEELQLASRICLTQGSELWGLSHLLADTSKDEAISDSGQDVSFYVILKMSQLAESAVKYLHRSADYRVEWVLLVCKFILTVLRDIFKFNCSVVSDKCSELETRLCSEAMVSVKLQSDIHVGEQCKSRSAKRLTQTRPLENRDIIKRCKIDCSLDESPSTSSDPCHSFSPQTSFTPNNSQISCLVVNCESFCRTWTSRRVMKKKLQGETALTDGLELEKKVSQAVRESEGESKKALLQFTLQVDALIEPGKTATIIKMTRSKVGTKEFTCFYPFFKTFFIKAADKYLAEYIGTI